MKINKYLQNAIIVGLFLSLFIPFIVSTDFFFPFITGKNFAFRILTEVVFALWIILALRDVKFRPRFSWLGAAFAAFVFLIGISDLMSPNVLKSFWSNFERMEGWMTLIHLFAYFLVASSVLNGEKRWTWFFQTSIGASVIMGGYGFMQMACSDVNNSIGGSYSEGIIKLCKSFVINQGGVRLDGTLGNATYLAAFMLINFFIALFLAIRSRKSISWRFAYGIIMALQLFIIYHTATRGAFVGLIAGLLVLLLIIFLFSHHKVHRSVSAGVLGVVIFVSVLGYSLQNTDFVKNQPPLSRLTSISVSEAGPRFMVWNMAWQGFKERPIFGWGQESFNYVFNKYYDPKMYAQEQWFDRTHNVIFDWLTAGGVLGLLAYLSLFVFALYYIWKQGDHAFSVKSFSSRLFKFWRGHEIPYFLEKSILTGLLAAYFVQNIFVFDNITSYILFFAILAYVHSISGWTVKHIHERVLDGALVNRVLAPLTIVAIGFIIYSCNIIPMRASATLIDALRPQQEGPEKNLEYFKTALGFHTFGNAEIREQLAQGALQVVSAKSASLSLKQGFYDFTRSELQKQVEQTPQDARYYLFQGSFLNRMRNYDEALIALTKASELSPKKQTIMFELGTTYVNKGDYEKALVVMKKALELEPDFKEAHIIYALTAVYAKKFQLASEIMAPLANTPSEYDDRIIQAYRAAGKNDVVVKLFEKRVKADPLDSQARLSLAGAYLNAGMRTKAVETLRTIANDFPSQAEQMDYYIREIQAGRNP